jgi:hypothetical protein
MSRKRTFAVAAILFVVAVVATKMGSDMELMKSIGISPSNGAGDDGVPALRASSRLVPFRTKRPPYKDSLLDVPNGTKCFVWDDGENADHWWTHHPLWSVSTENDTHSCFQYTPDPYYRKVYTNQFLSDCSKVTTRYMWNSG